MACPLGAHVVGVFVVAAVLTPPDVISQIGLAVPILLLYEVSIFGARMVERKKYGQTKARRRFQFSKR